MDKHWNITRAALAISLIALTVALAGNIVTLRVAFQNRGVIADAERGLTCLLQRAIVSAQASKTLSASEKQVAIEYYNREIAFLGGPRDDCLIELPSSTNTGGRS